MRTLLLSRDCHGPMIFDRFVPLTKSCKMCDNANYPVTCGDETAI